MIDKGCQELEEEMKRLEPEGDRISIAKLKLAIMKLNSKLRRKGKLSAYEIYYARDQNSGENLHLNDELIRDNQLEKRKDNRQQPEEKVIQVGDTVALKNRNLKHKANDIFLVTNKKNENITVQKILHPLKNTPTKIMSKTYNTKEKLLCPIHQPKRKETCQIRAITHDWEPFYLQFFKDTDSEDDEPVNKTKKNTLVLKKRIKESPQHIQQDSTDKLEWDN